MNSKKSLWQNGGICSEYNVTVDYAFRISTSRAFCRKGRTKPGTEKSLLCGEGCATNSVYRDQCAGWLLKEGFRVSEYLQLVVTSCMAGFVLKNTLSDNGGATWHLQMDAENNLTEVVETKNIIKTRRCGSRWNEIRYIDSLASMNMWDDRISWKRWRGSNKFFERSSSKSAESRMIDPDIYRRTVIVKEIQKRCAPMTPSMEWLLKKMLVQ